jgi:hypothetical protein
MALAASISSQYNGNAALLRILHRIREKDDFQNSQ